MSLKQQLEIHSLEQEIARLENSSLSLLSRGQRIFALLESLLAKLESHPTNLKHRKHRLSGSFASDIKTEDEKIADIQEKLKEELFFFNLKFTGTRKDGKTNRELALETIISHLENLEKEIERLEKHKHEKHRQTPDGRIIAEREALNREKCRQEVLTCLEHLTDTDRISELKVSPKHLNLAGTYGVELTQEMILTEWKKMLQELLLRRNFFTQKERIKNFQKYQSFTDNFSGYSQRFDQVKEWVAGLKALKDQTVLALADILANSEEAKQKFHLYGISGMGLSPETKKMLTAYDDLPIDQVYDSPAAMAYEYINHLLAVGLGGGNRDHALSQFEKLYNFRYYPDSKCPGPDAFGEKYSAQDFHYFDRQDYDPEFLLSFGANLGRLLANLRDEIKAEGKNIDPKSFLARFGERNYQWIKSLPDLNAPESRLANFPKGYLEPHGALNKDYYEDESLYHKFQILRQQAEAKLEKLVPVRWLEEELKQKQNKNQGVWETLANKVKLVNYLKFLEKNKDYHHHRPITLSASPEGKLELADRNLRQLANQKQAEYQKIEAEYQKYLQVEIASLVSEIKQAESKIFGDKSQVRTLHERLGTCQILSSHSLEDKIYGRISSLTFQAFKELSLTHNELTVINNFVKRGYQNLQEQKKVQAELEKVEKDLNRHPEKLDLEFLSEYSDSISAVSSYDKLINSLKLINVALSSLLKEKHAPLIREVSEKNKQYQDLAQDYNRRFHREGAYPFEPAIDPETNLADYL